MMIGGERAVVDKTRSIFAGLEPGTGEIPRTGGRQGRDFTHRAGLHSRRPRGREAFRQDGS